jgi:hypothetical protein
MEDGYSRGFGGSKTHHEFILSMYQMYRSAQPTVNPALQQQQRALADKMAAGQQRYMDGVNQQRDNRNAAFANQQREKAWRQNQEMMHIQDEHCLIWNDAHTYCLKVHN